MLHVLAISIYHLVIEKKKKKKKSTRHLEKFATVRSLFCQAQRNSTGEICAKLFKIENRNVNAVKQIAIVFEKSTAQDRQKKIEALKGIRIPRLSLVKF